MFQHLNAKSPIEASIRKRHDIPVIKNDVALQTHAEVSCKANIKSMVAAWRRQPCAPGGLSGADIEDRTMRQRGKRGTQMGDKGPQLNINKAAQSKEKGVRCR